MTACLNPFSQAYDRDPDIADSSERGDRRPVFDDGKTCPDYCLLSSYGDGWRSTKAKKQKQIFPL